MKNIYRFDHKAAEMIDEFGKIIAQENLAVHPHCFKDVDNLPVHYANKRAWITRNIFSIDFTHILCQQHRLDINCKVLLLLDNCSGQPPAEPLIKNNVYAMYFPPNVTSLI
uniref:DDE-1 domain-containing protein n=1 Tax=Scylla olivacea TaxID=85551 RepID=A0A0P4W644_SCYOL